MLLVNGSVECLKPMAETADTGTQVAKVLATMPALIWPILACFVVFMLRHVLARSVGRLTGIEAFGLKLSMSGGRAMDAAIELARKGAVPLEVPEGDRIRAVERANRERVLMEGAEILWVDDLPSNNRNEARMLRSFGAVITFAASTEETISALKTAAEQALPFHLVISDMKRDADTRAGEKMLEKLRAENVLTVPLIFYVAKANPGKPDGAFGLTARPDDLLHLVLDGLGRSRKVG